MPISRSAVPARPCLQRKSGPVLPCRGRTESLRSYCAHSFTAALPGSSFKMRCQAGVSHPAGCTPASPRYPVPPASPHPRWPIRAGFTRRAVHCRKRGLRNAPSPGKRRIRAFAVAGIRVAAARQRYRRHTPARAFDLQPRMGKTEIPEVSPSESVATLMMRWSTCTPNCAVKADWISRTSDFELFFGPGEHVDLARHAVFRQIPPGRLHAFQAADQLLPERFSTGHPQLPSIHSRGAAGSIRRI